MRWTQAIAPGKDEDEFLPALCHLASVFSKATRLSYYHQPDLGGKLAKCLLDKTPP
jgi:hypothetical protein